MTTRLFHFTDDPAFAVDPGRRPLDKFGMPTGMPCLYTTDDPYAWAKLWGEPQGRGYVAELESGRPAGELGLVQADGPGPEEVVVVRFDDVVLVRVVTVEESMRTWPEPKWWGVEAWDDGMVPGWARRRRARPPPSGPAAAVDEEDGGPGL